MRTFEIIGGIACLTLAVLACAPAMVLLYAFFSSGSPGISVHSNFILSVGSLTVSGWQLWLLAGGLAVIGAGLAILGIYVLSSPRSGR